MKNKGLFFLAIVLTIVIFDGIFSFASRTLEFDYTSLSPISTLLYSLAGFFGCRYFNFPTGIIAGFIAGLADSTIGWSISTAIEPMLPFEQPVYTTSMIASVIIVISMEGAFFGLIGSLIAHLFKGKKEKLD